MLAQNFKTAQDLGITAKEYQSLITVMKMFERREIAREEFHMEGVDCGSRACILGWCQRVTDGDVFREYAIDSNRALFGGLFLFGDRRRFKENDPDHAAIAIRSYLTTGDARWDLAVTT